MVIFITVVIDLLGFGIVLPILPLYGKHFQAHHNTLGLLMASFSAMQFLFAPLWGRVSDRVGRRPILILGLAGSAFFYTLFGYATSLGRDGSLLGLDVLPWLFICRIGAGIAGATIPTAQAYIADVTTPEERGKGMALIGAAFGIGFCIGPLLGATFLPDEPAVIAATETAPDETSAEPVEDSAPPSSVPGYLAGGLSGLALLSAIFLLPESLKPGARPMERHWLDLESLKGAVARPAIGMVLLTIFLTTFAFGQFETTLALLNKYLGLNRHQNYRVFAYIGFVLMLSQGLLVRRLIPRLGEKVMAIAGTVLMTAGLALIGMTAVERSVSMLYAIIPISVIGFSAVTPSLQSLLSRHTAASQQGGMLGLGQSISALARILGPWVGMNLHGLNILWPYWAGASLMAFCVLLALNLKRPEDAAAGSDAVAE